MRRLFIAIALLTIAHAAACQNHSSIRGDLSQASCFGTADITVAHKIAERWSIEGQTALNIKRLANGKDEETLQHWNALAGSVDQDGARTFRDNLTEVSISVSFWPIEVFRGPILSIGGLVRDRTGPDMFCCIGYSVPVWKGLCADICFRTCILETKRNGKLQYNGIRIGLSYAF